MTIDDSYKIINLIQEVMNFATEDEVIIYSENFEDESNDPHTTATTPFVDISTTQDPQESGINVTKTQLQSLKNKLFDKILHLSHISWTKYLA